MAHGDTGEIHCEEDIAVRGHISRVDGEDRRESHVVVVDEDGDGVGDVGRGAGADVPDNRAIGEVVLGEVSEGGVDCRHFERAG